VKLKERPEGKRDREGRESKRSPPCRGEATDHMGRRYNQEEEQRAEEKETNEACLEILQTTKAKQTPSPPMSLSHKLLTERGRLLLPPQAGEKRNRSDTSDGDSEHDILDPRGGGEEPSEALSGRGKVFSRDVDGDEDVDGVGGSWGKIGVGRGRDGLGSGENRERSG
jgi:hypothetical protein